MTIVFFPDVSREKEKKAKSKANKLAEKMNKQFTYVHCCAFRGSFASEITRVLVEVQSKLPHGFRYSIETARVDLTEKVVYVKCHHCQHCVVNIELPGISAVAPIVPRHRLVETIKHREHGSVFFPAGTCCGYTACCRL